MASFLKIAVTVNVLISEEMNIKNKIIAFCELTVRFCAHFNVVLDIVIQLRMQQTFEWQRCRNQ